MTMQDVSALPAASHLGNLGSGASTSLSLSLSLSLFLTRSLSLLCVGSVVRFLCALIFVVSPTKL